MNRKVMDREASAGIETPFGSASALTRLSDDELGMVAGGHHHHHRHHHEGHDDDGGGDGSDGGGSGSFLGQLLQQLNLASIIQIVNIAGNNTGTVNLGAGIAQGNTAGV